MLRILLTIAVAFVLAFGASSALSRTNEPVIFNDPAGDFQGGGDITQVSVSHDPRGVITFVVHVPGWPTIAPGRVVGIEFDSDENLSSQDWRDHYIHIFKNSSLPEDEDFGVYYDGRRSGIGHPPEWISYTWQNGTVTIKVDGRLLLVSKGEDGIGYPNDYPALKFSPPKQFKLRAVSMYVEEVGHPDTFLRKTALDVTDVWTYELDILRDLILKKFVVPKSVRGGKPLTVKMTAVRDDTGEVANGHVTCRARIGKTLLRSFRPWNPPLVASALANPSAVCSGIIPKMIGGKSTRGKTVKGEISLTVPEGPRGVTETRRFSVKVVV